MKKWHNKFGARTTKPKAFSYKRDLDEEDLKLWKEDEIKVSSTISHSHPHEHDHHHHTHGHDELDSHHHEHKHIIKIYGDERGYTIIGGEDEGLVE